MTYLIKCDGCGKIIEPPNNIMGDPYNPSGWFSRVKGETDARKTLHACCRNCIKDKEPIWTF